LVRDRNPAKGKPLLQQGARMATSTVDHGFTGYLLLKVLHAAQALAPREIDLEKET